MKKKFTNLDITLLIAICLTLTGLSFPISSKLKTTQPPMAIESVESVDDLLAVGYTVNTTYNGRKTLPVPTGSGVALWHDNTAYILTCGHVAECCLVEGVPEIIDQNAKETIKRFPRRWQAAEIEKTYYKDGKEIGKYLYAADVVLYSPAEDVLIDRPGLDLALLKIRNPTGFPKASIKFMPEDRELKVSDRIYHVGSLWGLFTEAYVEGYVSRLDYSQFDTKFNIVKLGGCPGSSGGGIFTKLNNKYYYCGMLTRGDPGTTNMIKPMSVIRKWLKDNKYGHLLN